MHSYRYVENVDPRSQNEMIVVEYGADGEPKVFARRGEVVKMTVAQAESLASVVVLKQVDDPPAEDDTAKKSNDHDKS